MYTLAKEVIHCEKNHTIHHLLTSSSRAMRKRALSSGVKKETPVTEFMTRDPVAISLEDSSLSAAATLKDYKIKWIPVVDQKQIRRIVGCISAQKMMAYILKESSAASKK